MPPISVVFIASGLAVWVNAMYFLGIGARPAEEPDQTHVLGPDPLKTVGWITLAAGVADLIQATYIIAGPKVVVLAGLVVFYGTFFVALGIAEVAGLDLRPVANLSFAVAIVPLLWWNFFRGGWMFRSILVVWVVTFLAITATVYGKFPGKALGALLGGVAVYTFWVPIIILALGRTIP
jgi:hypothetical protein